MFPKLYMPDKDHFSGFTSMQVGSNDIHKFSLTLFQIKDIKHTLQNHL